MKLPLVRKRSLWLPTWQGSLVIFFVIFGLAFLFLSEAHSFLAKSEPVEADILVVEGWVPDYVLEVTAGEFRNGNYRYLCTTGGPLSHGSYLARFDDWATLAASTLRRLGLPEGQLVVAPAPSAQRHRTYQSALALKKKLAEERIVVSAINVVTLATHARRTRLVYEVVFANKIKVGIISVPSKEYDPKRWWISSAGIKTVLIETIGWLAERVTNLGDRDRLNNSLR